MKNKYFSLLMLLLTSLLFWGCTPEETTVVVKASELKKAAEGGLGVAQIEMVFDVQTSNDPTLPEKIKRAALPFLGEGGKISIEKIESHRISDDTSSYKRRSVVSLEKVKLVGNFFIPVGTEQALSNAPESLMCLKYIPQNKTFQLVPGTAVYDLNRVLQRIDPMIKFEYNGGGTDLTGRGTTIKILNDTSVNIGVIAAKVNDNMTLSKTFNTSNGMLQISYNNDIYKNLAPSFILGTLPNVTPQRLHEEVDTLDF
jgi:hypothetical protein